MLSNAFHVGACCTGKTERVRTDLMFVLRPLVDGARTTRCVPIVHSAHNDVRRAAVDKSCKVRTIVASASSVGGAAAFVPALHPSQMNRKDL